MATTTARYVRQFSCTGGACPDTCCSGLAVRLTEEEVVRLKKGPGTAAWQRALEIELKPPPPGSPDSVFAILDHSESECAFLGEDRLCSAQAAIGHEQLPAICQDYPRQSATVGEQVQIWGSLGCPEMARLAFSAPDAMELVATDGGPSPRQTFAADPSREAMHALLFADELPLAVRFGAVALALDAAESIEGLADAAAAVRLEPGAFEAALAEVGADAVLRAVIARDIAMARRSVTKHARFRALIDEAVFTRPPTDADLQRFFVDRSDAAKPDIDVIEAMAEQSERLRDDGAFALAVSRYAGWRWATQPPADLAAARTLWGRVLAEVAAAELMMTTGAPVADALQVVARELVNVPDLDVLFDAYVAEQKIDALQGQVTARPGPAHVVTDRGATAPGVQAPA